MPTVSVREYPAHVADPCRSLTRRRLSKHHNGFVWCLALPIALAAACVLGFIVLLIIFSHICKDLWGSDA